MAMDGMGVQWHQPDAAGAAAGVARAAILAFAARASYCEMRIRAPMLALAAGMPAAGFSKNAQTMESVPASGAPRVTVTRCRRPSWNSGMQAAPAAIVPGWPSIITATTRALQPSGLSTAMA